MSDKKEKRKIMDNGYVKYMSIPVVLTLITFLLTYTGKTSDDKADTVKAISDVSSELKSHIDVAEVKDTTNKEDHAKFEKGFIEVFKANKKRDEILATMLANQQMIIKSVDKIEKKLE